MPEVICLLVDHAHVVGRDRLASQDVEVGLALELGAGSRIGQSRGLERAEQLAELDLFVVVHGLIAEEEHRVLLEGGADRPELSRREWVRYVDACDLRAEQRMELGDGDGAGVTHWRRSVPLSRRSPGRRERAARDGSGRSRTA